MTLQPLPPALQDRYERNCAELEDAAAHHVALLCSTTARDAVEPLQANLFVLTGSLCDLHIAAASRRTRHVRAAGAL